MAGPYPKNHALKLVVGLVAGPHRYQCVIPMVSVGAGASGTGRSNDLFAWLEETIIPPWIALLGGECQVVGAETQAVGDDPVVPIRRNYAPGTYTGAQEDENVPPQTSMLIAFYSDTQIALEGRTRVGKQFVGPCPEGAQDNGVLSVGQYGLLNTLALALATSFLGDTTGTRWYRYILGNEAPTPMCHVVDNGVPRDVSFTQRRRMQPLF